MEYQLTFGEFAYWEYVIDINVICVFSLLGEKFTTAAQGIWNQNKKLSTWTWGTSILIQVWSRTNQLKQGMKVGHIIYVYSLYCLEIHGLDFKLFLYWLQPAKTRKTFFFNFLVNTENFPSELTCSSEIQFTNIH